MQSIELRAHIPFVPTNAKAFCQALRSRSARPQHAAACTRVSLATRHTVERLAAVPRTFLLLASCFEVFARQSGRLSRCRSGCEERPQENAHHCVWLRSAWPAADALGRHRPSSPFAACRSAPSALLLLLSSCRVAQRCALTAPSGPAGRVESAAGHPGAGWRVRPPPHSTCRPP
jgi:hypothetical protein